MYFRIILIIFISIWQVTLAQKVHNTSIVREMQTNQFVRLQYENDLFVNTDYYYSQGVALVFAHRNFVKNPLNWLLIQYENSEIRPSTFGISTEINAFTPTDLEPSEIQIGDRPYAATWSLSSFAISQNSNTKTRLTSTITIGVLGTKAYGEEIQTFLHKNVSGVIPNGWKNQIANDIILQYDLSHEKSLLQAEYASLISYSAIQFGTYKTKLQLGSTLLLGLHDNPCIEIPYSKQRQIYAYAQAIVNGVGYDASLQGGILNRSSPYTISNEAIERLTFNGNLGLVYKTNRFLIELLYAYTSREFETSETHSWAGISIWD